MSRVSYYEAEDVKGLLHLGRWERNSKTTVTSKRGQEALKELREALLSLPQKALVKDTFCEINEEDGTVLACVLGAYALHKGLEPAKLRSMNDEGANETAYWAGGTNTLGLRFTLAWNLIDMNDEQTYSLSPEKRWQWFMDWLNNNIKSTP